MNLLVLLRGIACLISGVSPLFSRMHHYYCSTGVRMLVLKNEGSAVNNPRVALVSGFWGQNIGNAFFNIGGKWLLEQIFGSGSVGFFQDQPGYRTFHDQKKGNPGNDVGLLKYLDIDYVVLQGPLLTATFPQLWGPTLEELQRRGTRVVLLGAAFFKYRDDELSACRGFLEKIRPAAISTRDRNTYEVLDGWGLGVPLYDGLDSAFFVPKVFQPFEFNNFDYYAFNFDRYPEPSVSLGGAEPAADASFDFDGASWSLNVPRLVSKLAHRSKVQAYLGHLMDRRSLPVAVNGKTIVRPEHRFNPHMTYKIYQHANAFASDEPWTYFSIYAGSKLTLSDRVHACVMTLAYGNHAMLFTPSPRAAIFERLGCARIRDEPVCLDMDYLEYERQKQLAWLRECLG